MSRLVEAIIGKPLPQKKFEILLKRPDAIALQKVFEDHIKRCDASIEFCSKNGLISASDWADQKDKAQEILDKLTKMIDDKKGWKPW